MANIMTNTNIVKRQQTIMTVWGTIEKYRAIKKLNYGDLAKKVNRCRATISNRKEHPGDMPLEEMLRYKEALDIPDVEFMEALTGRKILQIGAEKP